MPVSIRRVRSRLKAVTPGWIRESYRHLVKEQCGCAYTPFAEDGDGNVYSVCIGWHYCVTPAMRKSPKDDGYRVAWMIGRQSRDNVMQTDFDIDFKLPYDKKTGDVDDTVRVFDSEPATLKELASVASEIKKTAVRVAKDWC